MRLGVRSGHGPDRVAGQRAARPGGGRLTSLIGSLRLGRPAPWLLEGGSQLCAVLVEDGKELQVGRRHGRVESLEATGVPVEVMEVSGTDHVGHGIPDDQVEEIFLHSPGWALRVVGSRGTDG